MHPRFLVAAAAALTVATQAVSSTVVTADRLLDVTTLERVNAVIKGGKLVKPELHSAQEGMGRPS